MSKFSPQLHSQIIHYFQKRGVEISNEQAESYLHSWAKLFVYMANSKAENPKLPAGQQGRLRP